MFNKTMLEVFEFSCTQAKRQHLSSITVDFFLLTLLASNTNMTGKILSDCGVDIRSLCSNLNDVCTIHASLTRDGDGKKISHSVILDRVFKISILVAKLRDRNNEGISEFDFILGILANDESYASAFLVSQDLIQKIILDYNDYLSARK